MSIVPNDKLESADSLALQTFGVIMNIDSAVNKIDIFTRYRAFWKSCVIRNTQAVDNIEYRTNSNSSYESLTEDSEILVKGWGSYLEVISSAILPSGSVNFECVTVKNGMKNAK